MIGPRPCAYACAYVDPVFTSQSYDVSISTSTKNELVRFSCVYAYAYVDPVFTCLHICDYAYVDQFSLAYTCGLCLCLCLCASENQSLALTSPLRLTGRASGLVNVTRRPRLDSCCDYSEFFLGAACDTEYRFKRRATAVPN